MRKNEDDMDEKEKSGWGRSLPGELQDKWPRDDKGEFEEPAFLKSCTTKNLEDELLVNLLGAYGVPALRQYPCDGGFAKVIMGSSATGANIFVPKSMLSEAQQLCEGVHEDEDL